MIKIRNFIIFMITFLAFLAPCNAGTTKIELGDMIEGVNLHLKTPTVEKNKNMYQIINKDLNTLVYCIEPGVLLKDGYFSDYTYLEGLNLGLSYQDWEMLSTIAYFGYGYEDRTEIRWYVATQFMIWSYILENKGEIYFIDNNNNKIDLYVEEIAAIKKDVLEYDLMPSFSSVSGPVYRTKINESFTLKDSNHILSKVNTTSRNTIDYSIDDNTITVNPTKSGTFYVYFSKDNNVDFPTIYYNGDSQTVMDRGLLRGNNTFFTVIVSFPSLTITKKAAEDSPISLEGAEYGLYYNDGTLYTTLKTNKDGVMFLDEIPQGEYYLKELKAPYGYQLNEDIIPINVEQEDLNIEITEQLSKKNITIEKYLENYNNTYELEANAKFQIINSNYPEITYNLTTDKFGKINIALPFGEYIIKQISGKEGYLLSDEIKLTINEDYPEYQSIMIKDKEILGSVYLEKRDALTNNLILSSAQFKIKNIATNEYLKINDSIVFMTSNGILTIENIPYGSYELEEVIAPLNYKLPSSKITFSITTSNEIINLVVLNELDTGTLIINKIDNKTAIPLSDVLFGIYNLDNELVAKQSTDASGSINLSLPTGKYLIRELQTLDNYELNLEEIAVEIKSDIKSIVTISNRLKINVPPTGSKRELITLLISVAIILVGLVICNYDKRKDQNK